MNEKRHIVTADAMAACERKSIDEGADSLTFMEAASLAAANEISQYLQSNPRLKSVTIFVGKGNNGGDGLCIAKNLLARGIDVSCHLLFPIKECSELLQHQAKAVSDHLITDRNKLPEGGLIVDAILGTGFSGKLQAEMEEVICEINDSGLPIVAIDIPSGVNGNTGQVMTTAVQADITIALGHYKMGHFFQEGYRYCGKILRVDFGLEKKYSEQMDIGALLFDPGQISLPQPKKTQNKYEAGALLAIAGSESMAGAAALLTTAALRSGCGIAFLYALSGLGLALARIDREVIVYEKKLPEAVRHRCRAVAIGPGLDIKEKRKIQKEIQKIKVPSVIDASALVCLSDVPPPPQSILTPHAGELKKLLGDMTPQEYATQHDVILVAKGAPNVIYSRQHPPLVIPCGTPAMATAGCGDVLTGVIGALLAKGLPPYAAAYTGVYLHGKAGEVAEKELSSYSVMATDIINALPKLFHEFLARNLCRCASEI